MHQIEDRPIGICQKGLDRPVAHLQAKRRDGKDLGGKHGGNLGITLLHQITRHRDGGKIGTIPCKKRGSPIKHADITRHKTQTIKRRSKRHHACQRQQAETRFPGRHTAALGGNPQ